MEWAGLIELAGRDQRTLTVCGNSGVRPPSQPLLQFSDPVSRTLWKTMTQTNSLRYLTFCANSGVRPPSQPLLQFSDPMSRTLWKTMTQTNRLRYRAGAPFQFRAPSADLAFLVARGIREPPGSLPDRP